MNPVLLNEFVILFTPLRTELTAPLIAEDADERILLNELEALEDAALSPVLTSFLTEFTPLCVFDVMFLKSVETSVELACNVFLISAPREAIAAAPSVARSLILVRLSATFSPSSSKPVPAFLTMSAMALPKSRRLLETPPLISILMVLIEVDKVSIAVDTTSSPVEFAISVLRPVPTSVSAPPIL